MQKALLFALIFALGVAVFTLQNTQSVTIQFLFWSIPEFPLALVIFGAALSGAVLAVLFGVFQQFSMYMRIRDLRGKAKKLEREIENLTKEKEKLEEKAEVPEPAPVPEVPIPESKEQVAQPEEEKQEEEEKTKPET